LVTLGQTGLAQVRVQKFWECWALHLEMDSMADHVETRFSIGLPYQISSCYVKPFGCR